MNMYDDYDNKIGTKTYNKNKGLLKPDGSYGNRVNMNFFPTANVGNNTQKPTTSFQNINNFSNGIRPPKVTLKTGEENTNKIGNFLKYLTDKRNANMQSKYDELNLKNNQFLKNLANSKYQARQNRLEKASLFDRELQQKNNQFNKTYDFNRQKFDREHDLEMQKYLHSNNKKNDPEDYKIDRTKIFTKDPTSIIPEWDDLDENTKREAMQIYINNGVIPKIKKLEDGWFSDTYAIDKENSTNNTQSKGKSQQDDEEKRFLEWKKLNGYS